MARPVQRTMSAVAAFVAIRMNSHALTLKREGFVRNRLAARLAGCVAIRTDSVLQLGVDVRRRGHARGMDYALLKAASASLQRIAAKRRKLVTNIVRIQPILVANLKTAIANCYQCYRTERHVAFQGPTKVPIPTNY